MSIFVLVDQTTRDNFCFGAKSSSVLTKILKFLDSGNLMTALNFDFFVYMAKGEVHYMRNIENKSHTSTLATDSHVDHVAYARSPLA